MSDFRQALAFVLAREGGYVPPGTDDPGGETKYGISKRAHPYLNIKDLTLEQATQIYELEYWLPSHCDTLDQAAALAVFDTVVNLGVGRGLALWQSCHESVEELLWARLAYYEGLTSLRQFFPGWVKRVLLLREAVHFAQGAPDVASPGS